MKPAKIIFSIVSLLSLHAYGMELRELEHGDHEQNSHRRLTSLSLPKNLNMDNSDFEDVESQNLSGDKLEIVSSRKNPRINYNDGCECDRACCSILSAVTGAGLIMQGGTAVCCLLSRCLCP